MEKTFKSHILLLLSSDLNTLNYKIVAGLYYDLTLSTLTHAPQGKGHRNGEYL